MPEVELDFAPSPEGLMVGRALFFGPTGSGKTYMAGHFIRDVLAWPRDLIRCVAPPSKPTLAKFLGVPHLGTSITDRDAQEKRFRDIFKTVTEDYNRGGHDIGLVLDDADFYFSQAGRSYGVPALAELVKLGREAGLGQVFCAQGSAAVSKDLISNSSTVFFFRTTEPNLLDYARRYMRDIPDVERRISELDDHVALVYAPTLTPKLQGLAVVIDGVIHWESVSSDEEEEEPSPTDEAEEATSPEDTVSTPGAARPSPTGTSPASATSTTPSGGANRTA